VAAGAQAEIAIATTTSRPKTENRRFFIWFLHRTEQK
jgi:hypothetical protein